MWANANFMLPAGRSKLTRCWSQRVAEICRSGCRNLLTPAAVLMISLILSGPIPAAGQLDSGGIINLDSRWLPWIGTWRLVTDTVNEVDRGLSGDYLLDINASDNGRSVTVTASLDAEEVVAEKIFVDGSRQIIQSEGCNGWQEYSWSDSGKRLLFKSESTCAGEPPRSISGMSMIAVSGTWVDIRLLRSDEERTITIRKYRQLSSSSTELGKKEVMLRDTGRITVRAPFSIEEVIELSRKVEPEVLEAAIYEFGKPFEINSKSLQRLADAEVPPQIVDLMVALSFPDKFVVERHAIAPIQAPRINAHDGRRYYYGGLWWDPWPWSWSWWYGPYNYGYVYFPVDRDRAHSGRLVAGQGYTRVYNRGSYSQPRYAQPRGAGGASRGGQRQPSYNSSAGGSSSSGNSSSSSSGGSSGNSSSSSPSASPGGYSSSGSSTRQAHPRQ